MKQKHEETLRRGNKPMASGGAQPMTNVPIRPAHTGLPGEREQVIRQTAYALYEARGHVEGHALEDWLKAEAQFH